MIITYLLLLNKYLEYRTIERLLLLNLLSIVDMYLLIHLLLL